MNDRTMRTGALMVALLSACVAFQLNASMLSPVLPSIATELGVDEAAVSLSQTAFFTSAALFAVFVPRLSDIKGRRRVLVVTLTLVAVGSVLAAVAPSILVLDVGRVIQGCSGSVIAICLLMLRAAVPDVRRYGALMGVVTAVNGGIAGVDVLLGRPGIPAGHQLRRVQLRRRVELRRPARRPARRRPGLVLGPRQLRRCHRPRPGHHRRRARHLIPHTSYLIPRPTAAEIPCHQSAGDGLHTTMERKAYS